MASSSVSQESLDMDDFDTTARRNRIRVHRGHGSRGSLPYRTLPDKGDGGEMDKDGRSDNPGENGDHHSSNTLGISSLSHLPGGDHESPTRSAAARLKDKRSRPNHMKGKLPKDKRKLREKRRSTGVVHCMPSTESTGDSLDDEDDDDEDAGVETKKNTCYNESSTSGHHHQTLYEARHSSNSSYSPKRGNKSPSDLEADLEDNQDYDSTVSHSETNLTLIGRSESYEASRPLPSRQGAITGLSRKIGSASTAGSKHSSESRNVFQYGDTNNSPNVRSDGTNSPSLTTHSSTSSTSSFFTRHREFDSPRSYGFGSTSNSSNNNVFSHSNFSNTTTNNPGSPASASRSMDPNSLLGDSNSHSQPIGSDSQYSHHNLQSSHGGVSSFKDSSNSVTGGMGDKPQYLSGQLPSSLHFRDSDRSVGTVHARVRGYQSPRPFSSASQQSAPVVQQQSENITQLEKMLDKEREDNKRLQQRLNEKDKKIAELEKAIELLNSECDGLDEDNLKLQEENKALIRAMSKLTSNV